MTKIQVIKNVAWLDERPQCQHLIACWLAGKDTGERCPNYGQPSPGYCPMNGGLCAMCDPDWVFAPGWNRWAGWMTEGHGYVTMDVWPGFKSGDLVAYVVSGDCMEPTYGDGQPVIARLGADWENGDACVFSRRVPGWGIPLQGKSLKRLERVGDDRLFVWADNPTFAPMLLPTDAVTVRAVAVNGSLEKLAPHVAMCHVFVQGGRIVPSLRAVAVASAGY